MINISYNITTPHLFLPISALSAESESLIFTSRFNIYETLQVNSSNFLISNNTFNQDM